MPRETPETGKQRAARIPLDYFRRPNRLEQGKLWLAVLAAVAAGGAALRMWSADGRQRWHAPGPVSLVHAALENDCSACHVPFAPIRDDAWAATSLSAKQSADQRCAACHRGPIHHANELAADVRSCSACHEEHRGRQTSLVRVADRMCTACHADLASHRAPLATAPAIANRVTDFERDHPEFRSILADPGGIKFSHKLHMARGLAASADDRSVRKLSDLGTTDRAHYRLAGQRDSDLVQLECRACHQFDSDALHSDDATWPARADGRRPLPIRYEVHCRACHPLTFDPGMVAASYAPNAVALLPHRLHPEQIAALLRNHYALQVVESDPRLWDLTAPRSTPDHPPDWQRQSALTLLNERVAVAAAHVEHECQKCHELSASKPAAAGPAEPTPVVLKEIVPADLPQVWYAHAEFNHAAHRAIDCAECHARAAAVPGAKESASDSSRDVLIPPRDTCLRCHSRPRETTSGPAGGARIDCVECHRYHNGDRPLEGLGAEARGATGGRTAP